MLHGSILQSQAVGRFPTCYVDHLAWRLCWPSCTRPSIQAGFRAIFTGKHSPDWSPAGSRAICCPVFPREIPVSCHSFSVTLPLLRLPVGLNSAPFALSKSGSRFPGRRQVTHPNLNTHVL